MELQGKNVFITGSTRGIGLAMAKAFAQQGANIVLNGRKEISEELITEIKNFGVNCIGLSGDISDFSSAKQMIEQAQEQLGDIHVLVNNAGMNNDKLLLRMKEEDFESVLKVNLTGTFNMTQPLLKKMLKQKQGVIINMASVSGLTGNVGQANYAASKAGVVGFTKTVAKEAASRGITCNAIAPGFITTDMTDVLSDKVKTQINETVPLQRLGNPEDIAQTAIFLAQNPYITGQVISVDGGLTM
ncbi:3-oxoacyl-[acyl-carrier protein] reductase [Tetragenococcus muriaticus PMC-11-5]|uniref:3-oxoacyl-[acyl-carrier-protein] reductase n=1 Tax=Tetragenococcus muriaticus PMC-11-5 TaxID=1302649 RepID=A0A091C3A5_9ENTE|nr:3-oxoacyl-[acyl-carrier-protein] reductase [Tetragenococcus muriaticus]KFN90562.1 3-oxoacyl-[acyl-carrier protein] reductase [Tetragenococcus muriaticus PMC-11-5]